MDTKTDYDVVVVGAGPAGLQAGVSFAADGVSTLVVDKGSVGGQAGQSSLIENLLGYADGISGKELADRGIAQLRRFGATLRVPYEVQRIVPQPDGTFVLVGEDRTRTTAKAVVLAVGLQYILLDARNVTDFFDRGIKYGSPVMEPERWRGKRVAVVGGANSAAQAACYLARSCGCQVQMLVRGPRIDEKMSSYMASDIEALPGITVHLNTQVKEAFGDGSVFKGVVVVKNGEEMRIELDFMHILIGATPHTAWLDDLVAVNKYGFVLTDTDIPTGAWKGVDRPPFSMETSVPGIFAAGDVDAFTSKRASVAIGAGSSVTPSVRRYLQLLRERQEKVLQAAS